MRRVVAAINMTLDGSCDHTAGLPDPDIHNHYRELLSEGGSILYGRITYQLMEYWRTFLENPSEEKSMNDFAIAIDKIPKIVFSHTLRSVDWKSASIASKDLQETVLELKAQPGKDIFVGSRSLILQLMNLRLIDEFQLCIFPVATKNSMPLFAGLEVRTLLKLVQTKVFEGGAVILYYEPKNES
ncbi:dihydrofolate reductase [Leptospira ognonensis]|uniref:Dihydrofolate reductase n=1 Tax=Leptospira ognonensis TaxID=2484945 RepID=A0A4R9JVP6_9LEPT|nr:dihydrofolate reductase family protein [Leptospira ognonensis]TGL56391.1 dihydrofolate reductase [Leptospira ognonensis]